MQQNPDQNGELMDIEDLNRLGRVRGPCPFYLSREMAATANIVFMPYNYLVDPKIRGGLQTQWANAVLIFDEAHNIEVPVRADLFGIHVPKLQTASHVVTPGRVFLAGALPLLCTAPPALQLVWQQMREISTVGEPQLRGVAQGVCSEAGSFDLTGAKLGSAIQEMLAAVEVALVKRDSEGQSHSQVTISTICIP